MEIAVLACGCFWGPEKKFGSLNGVYKTEVGYCGGKTEKTTYQEVCSGETNHAEVKIKMLIGLRWKSTRNKSKILIGKSLCRN